MRISVSFSRPSDLPFVIIGLLGQLQPGPPLPGGSVGSQLAAPVGFAGSCLGGIVNGSEPAGHKAVQLRK